VQRRLAEALIPDEDAAREWVAIICAATKKPERRRLWPSRLGRSGRG
jgi:hypothetical protein